MQPRLSLVLRFVVAAVFLVACALKLADPTPTIDFVRWLARAPHPLSLDIGVVALVAAIEAVLGVLLSTSRGVAPIVASIALLLVYASILAWAALHPSAPACACLGAVKVAGPYANAAGVVRNVGLIGCLVYCILTRRETESFPHHARTVDSKVRAGFTLIELLVGIAIVAVLIAMLLPALRGARAQAAIVKRLSVVQQTGVALALYQDSNAEVFPYMGMRGNPDAKLVLDNRPIEFTAPYFFQCALYFNLISPEYAPIDASVEILVHESRPDLRDVLRSPLYLTQTAFAAPSYFGPFETPDDRSLYRPVRRTEMVFPSQKVLLLDLRSGSHAEEGSIRWAPNRVLVSMGDGSTRLREFVLDEENGNWSVRSYYGLLVCGMTTHDGIAGRDF